MPNLGRTIERFVSKMRGIEGNPLASVEDPAKVYLRALQLRTLDDVETVKEEVRSGNILILRITPLAQKSVKEVKRAVDELCEFTESVGGDIARLGAERVVVTPSSVQIWREKTSIFSGERTATAA